MNKHEVDLIEALRRPTIKKEIPNDATTKGD